MEKKTKTKKKTTKKTKTKNTKTKQNKKQQQQKRCKLDFVIQNSNKIMCDYKVYYYLVVY